MKGIKNKIIWITGATSGMGYELTKALLANGAKVIVSGINKEKWFLENKETENCKFVVLDIEKEELFYGKVKEAIAAFGEIDILINNAAIAQSSRALTTMEEVENRILSINYINTIKLTKCIIPYFIDKRAGSIVMISDIEIYLNSLGRSSYAASKAALTAYSACLRTELAHFNINVSVLLAGVMPTDFYNKALTAEGNIVSKKHKTFGLPLSEVVKKAVKAISGRKKQQYLCSRREFYTVKWCILFPNWKIGKTVK